MTRLGGSLLLVAALVAAPSAHAAGSPARFQAGAAVRSVHPNEPVGPAGSTVGQVPGTLNVRDPLETRAVYVGNGARATVFVATDIFGQFAAVEQGDDLGLQGIREIAARRVTDLGGPPLRAQDIVIASSHSHATGSVIGFWGKPPVKFMELLRDRQVEAIVAAARAARPAHLEWGQADGARLNSLVLGQVNAYEGWIPDGQVTALRATDATTGATIATYATIPVHPVLMPGVAFDPQILSADYPGAVRVQLDRLLGGITVVAPGTLGRQTTPWSPAGKASPPGLADLTLDWFSTEAASIVLDALRDAHPVADGRIASTEAMQTTAVLNGAVLALAGANRVDNDFYEVASAGKAPYPLNRQQSPPWQDGALLTTPLTAVRIGGLLFLSQPGEPFAEIRLALRDLVRDADQVVAISQAQDALGYYYPAAVAPLVLAYPVNDHALFNVAATFGDAVVQRDVALARELGFEAIDGPTATPPTGNAYERAATSGIQFLASPHTGSACGGSFAPTFQAAYTPIVHQAHVASGPPPVDDTVHWDFGDGTSADTGYLFKGSRGSLAVQRGGESLIRHAFPPGRYTVTVSARDEAGGAPTWSLPVVVHPELRVTVRARAARGRVRLKATATGGSGRALRVTWALPGGARREGAAIELPRRAARRVTVAVADADGAVARSKVRLSGDRVRSIRRTCAARPGEAVGVRRPG